MNNELAELAIKNLSVSYELLAKLPQLYGSKGAEERQKFVQIILEHKKRLAMINERESKIRLSRKKCNSGIKVEQLKRLQKQQSAMSKCQSWLNNQVKNEVTQTTGVLRFEPIAENENSTATDVNTKTEQNDIKHHSMAFGLVSSTEKDSSSTSNYDNTRSSTPRTHIEETPASDFAGRIPDTFAQFVADRHQRHEENLQNRPHAKSCAYIEKLLNKLPVEEANEVKFEMISQLQKKVLQFSKSKC